MKVFLLSMVVIVVIIALSSLVVGYVKKTGTGAALIMSGLDGDAVKAYVITYYQTVIIDGTKSSEPISVDDLAITYHDLDVDGDLDLIAILNSRDTCGSGGCIATIFLQDDTKTFTPINFRYAVKTIEVLEGITHGLRDIRINNDTAHRMIWNGAQYMPETI